VTSDFPALASGLGTNANIDQIARLHVYHKWHSWEPCYEQLFDDQWDEFEVKTETGSILKTQSLFTKWEEFDALINAGMVIRNLIAKGVTVFPKLQTVSMGGIGERIYNSDSAYAVEKVLTKRCNGRGRILALSLLDLPTAQHYCQSVAFGPLALHNRLLISKSALKTFTIHLEATHILQLQVRLRSYSFTTDRPRSCQWISLQDPHLCPLPIAPEPEPKWLRILISIITMLCRPTISLANPETGETVPFKGGITAELMESTRIEMHDFVRTNLFDKPLTHEGEEGYRNRRDTAASILTLVPVDS
jgi:hypothetical protein